MQIPSIQEDQAKWAPVLKKICWYVVLAPADSDQVTLLNTTAADKKLVELPEYKDLLQTFIVKEVCLSACLPAESFLLNEVSHSGPPQRPGDAAEHDSRIQEAGGASRVQVPSANLHRQGGVVHRYPSPSSIAPSPKAVFLKSFSAKRLGTPWNGAE